MSDSSPSVITGTIVSRLDEVGAPSSMEVKRGHTKLELRSAPTCYSIFGFMEGRRSLDFDAKGTVGFVDDTN